MRSTNAKRTVLAVALLWLAAWGGVGVWTGVSPAWLTLYFAGVAAYAALGAWSEHTRWLPFAFALVLTAILAAITFLLVPVVLGGLIVTSAILMPMDADGAAPPRRTRSAGRRT